MTMLSSAIAQTRKGSVPLPRPGLQIGIVVSIALAYRYISSADDR
jgi:hypothetical protein